LLGPDGSVDSAPTVAEKARGVWIDPRTKVLVLLVINTVLIATGANPNAVWARLALAGVPVLLALLARMYALAAWSASVYVVAWLLDTFWVPLLDGAAVLLVSALTGFVLRIGPSLVCAVYAVRSTTVGEFIAALQRSRVPQMIVIPLAVMLRFMPTTVEEHRFISDAMRLRGVGGAALLKDPVRALEYRLVPLLTSLVRIGDDLSAAAVTRALGAPWPRTSIARSGMRLLDWLLIMLAIAAAAIQVFA
jgi:energy-coupling factor transporter transmembrane protein EcfT